MTAKDCTEHGYNIAAEYEGSASFFRSILSTGKGDLGRLVAAAAMITNQAKLSAILEAFAKIGRAVKDLTIEDIKGDIEPLRQRSIFPILRKRSGEDYDTLADLNRKGQPWFIADRSHLRDSFLGYVDILAFAPEDLEAIEEFLRVLGLSSRKMSLLVATEMKPSGISTLHREYTSRLRSKVPYIVA